jgi:hypothetical protein
VVRKTTSPAKAGENKSPEKHIMNILKRFKAYSVRIPKVAVESLPESLRPAAEYINVDVSGSKTSVEINAILADAAKQAVCKIAQLVSALTEALSASGADTSFLNGIPDLALVESKLVANLKFEDALRESFREAAGELYMTANPAVAKAVEDAEAAKEAGKEPSARSRGPVVKLDF